ncbi:cysteine synthase [Mycobacteroides abscessus subsp. abscessus]|nr:cysteine synthase [Mycobacteroides abscessus subsp. abscessus]SIM51861.1 cysteine synthase [Mycobacteroides abscessus subsp. abscessus]SLF28747.1 cysteine synthase [Mycobacteroides abscessus subsp. abscessus]SLH60942.1 cysteine synthase [Mycobacteroides abscessus subsp. abscessus]
MEDRSGTDEGDQVWGVDGSPAGLGGVDQLVGHRQSGRPGSSIYPRNVDYPAFAEAHWVAPAEAVWACRTLARTYYTSGGWSVGAVALVAGWAARTHRRGTTIAAVFPDGPLRYFDTIYNDNYCREHDLLTEARPSHPAVIRTPAAKVVQSWTRCTTVVDPSVVQR